MKRREVTNPLFFNESPMSRLFLEVLDLRDLGVGHRVQIFEKFRLNTMQISPFPASVIDPVISFSFHVQKFLVCDVIKWNATT